MTIRAVKASGRITNTGGINAEYRVRLLVSAPGWPIRSWSSAVYNVGAGTTSIPINVEGKPSVNPGDTIQAWAELDITFPEAKNAIASTSKASFTEPSLAVGGSWDFGPPSISGISRSRNSRVGHRQISGPGYTGNLSVSIGEGEGEDKKQWLMLGAVAAAALYFMKPKWLFGRARRRRSRR